MICSPLLLALSLTGAGVLSSCGSKADSDQTKEHLGEAAKLRQESDDLATAAAAIQDKIRNAGTSEMTSAEIVLNLAQQEKDIAAEGVRLEMLAGDLTQANASLAKERTAFSQKYLKSGTPLSN